jgi:predicted transcriptional regulator YdeE
MNSRNVDLPAFQIMGISVRTTKQSGRSQKDIGALWERFIREDIAEKIPGKQSNDVYCVYTDYETDFNGPYTTFIGCKVKDAENIPEGLSAKIIPALTYRRFVSKGKIPHAVMTTWMAIWQSGIPRSYTADFDLYGQASRDIESDEVETYVSIKSS